MLQNAYSLEKISADIAENERHFAENLPRIGNYPTGPSSSPRGGPRGFLTLTSTGCLTSSLCGGAQGGRDRSALLPGRVDRARKKAGNGAEDTNE